MKSLLIIIILLTPAILIGQEKVFPITISLYNEATAIPYSQFFSLPIHPGIQLGTEFNYNLKEHSRLFQSANITYFYHNHLAQGIGLNTELGV